MNEERDLAANEGRESPVWDTIEDTHMCYNSNLKHLLTQMKYEDMVFVASHNKDTCDIAMELADERGFKESQRVRFGQLRGFSDQVTSAIETKGFKVFKYLPFGPTE